VPVTMDLKEAGDWIYIVARHAMSWAAHTLESHRKPGQRTCARVQVSRAHETHLMHQASRKVLFALATTYPKAV